jgi:hypothetical protein
MPLKTAKNIEEATADTTTNKISYIKGNSKHNTKNSQSKESP